MALATPTNRVASICCNLPLSSSICRSISTALRESWVYVSGGRTLWAVFKHSLDAAIRNVITHPRGKLFRRLVEFGPHHPDDPKALTSDGETVLSDPECGEAVEFVFSHMVNRFKGELAELLALEPCIQFFERQKKGRRLPANGCLYWGDAIQERRLTGKAGAARWGSFTKGADGLLAQEQSGAVSVCGIVEVKSMVVPQPKLLAQIDHHAKRLKGGVKLGVTEFAPDRVRIHPGLVRVIVRPSAWRLSREFHWEKGDHGGENLVRPPPSDPPVETRTEQVGTNLWQITLAWSKEALEQAAYEMTFGYMAEVGWHVFKGKPMPKGWEGFTPEEVGYNAVKAMLYYMPLRPLSPRQERLAIRLYNVYGFGYPLGVDSKEMLWPKDLKR